MIVVGGETAQMPDLYGEHGFDLAGFAVGWLKPQEHLTVETMRPGDELWGWSSSGPHSNGFSWLRRLFDSARDANFIREQLMPPTKLYAKSFFELRDKTLNPGDLHGAFHVTGSGVLNFVRSQPKGRTIGFDLKEWGEQPAPVWIQGVAERAGLPRGARVLRDLAVDHDQARTLWTTFNMGYGFAVVLAPELVAREETRLKSSGLVRLGRVIDQPCVRVGDLTLS